MHYNILWTIFKMLDRKFVFLFAFYETVQTSRNCFIQQFKLESILQRADDIYAERVEGAFKGK